MFPFSYLLKLMLMSHRFTLRLLTLKVAHGYFSERRCSYLNRVLGMCTLTDFSDFWPLKKQMFKFYKALNFRANKINEDEILAFLKNIFTSSNQRLGECVRSKMDSQSVAEHDRRHTMLFNMPEIERREESHYATFWRTDCVTSQKNICSQNKLEFVIFFSKGFNCQRNCDTARVLGMLKQNFIFFPASYAIVIWMLQKKRFKRCIGK